MEDEKEAEVQKLAEQVRANESKLRESRELLTSMNDHLRKTGRRVGKKRKLA